MSKTNIQSAADLHSTDPLTLLQPARKFSQFGILQCAVLLARRGSGAERSLVIFKYGNFSMFVIKWNRKQWDRHWAPLSTDNACFFS